METQIALLRVLQEREFERVGGTEILRADVRVISATNRDLQTAITDGAFRSDLYYRINVFPIKLPPLRERKEDVPLLVNYFVDRYAKRAGKKIKHIQKKALEALKGYSWPVRSWSNRPGFDEIGVAVSGLFTIEVPLTGRSSPQWLHC